ncbi:MAG: hypothetical protein NVS4B2_29350 [Chloroflexota bacterium]
MALGEIVSGTFDILRSRLMAFLAIGAAYTIAMFVAFFAFGLIIAAAGVSLLTGGFGSAILALLVGGLILVAIGVVAGAVAACAYINIARGIETVQGEDIVQGTIGALRRAWKSCPNLLVALLLLGGAWFAASILIVIVGAALGTALSSLLSLIWLVAAIWLGVNFAFVPQAAVVDGASPIAAFQESMQLVSGHWWRTFGYLIVAGLIALGGAIVMSIVIAIIGAIVSHIPVLGTIIISVLYAGMTAVFYAFYITYGTLMFFDLKARKSESTQGIPATVS